MELDAIFGKIAESKIQEAIEAGHFDNLPGKGKPLVLDEDPMTPPHLRLANRILKNANILPDWMQIHKDLLRERAETIRKRIELISEGQKRRARLTYLPADHPAVLDFARWHTHNRAAHHRRVRDVNDSILKLSMNAPSTVVPPPLYKIDQEMADFDEAFPRLPQQPPPPAPEPDGPEGLMKRIARELYRTGEGGGSVQNLQEKGVLPALPDWRTMEEERNAELRQPK